MRADQREAYHISGWTHIYPAGDCIKHNLTTLKCVCLPRIDVEEHIVKHKPQDKRELKEFERMKAEAKD